MKNNPIIYCCLLAVFAIGYSALAGRTVYVATNGLSQNAYSNWTDAATNIQLAVNVATNGDTVVISNGTYYLTTNVLINTNITDITVQSVNNNPSEVIVNGNGSVRCFWLSGSGVVLAGLTITNGRGSGAGVIVTGSGASATLTNCIISCNSNATLAGGVYIAAPTRIVSCVISGNSSANGGGVYFVNANSTVINSTISRNYSSSIGGGVSFDTASSATSLVNCVISKNTAVTQGGGLYTRVNGAGTEIARNCLIVSNVGTVGGIYYDSTGVGNLVACTIAANSSSGGSSIGNIGMQGPGGSAGVVRDCIIYGGVGGSPASRNDLYIWYAAYSNNFYNCSLGVNSTDSFPINLAFGSMIANPLFVSSATGIYRLLINSPCINAGTNLSWMTGALDLDGHRRIDVFSGRADIGAYEFLPAGSMFIVR